ncbi:hypothetical protein BC831DRAFT_548917 [Entophlyctis helioformis]|nr:hypothetical protein BC831DRAFT_548917 [Entophlyctis helioformis]
MADAVGSDSPRTLRPRRSSGARAATPAATPLTAFLPREKTSLLPKDSKRVYTDLAASDAADHDPSSTAAHPPKRLKLLHSDLDHASVQLQPSALGSPRQPAQLQEQAEQPADTASVLHSTVPDLAITQACTDLAQSEPAGTAQPKPVEAVEPAEPAEPAESLEPAEPVKPVEPVQTNAAAIPETQSSDSPASSAPNDAPYPAIEAPLPLAPKVKPISVTLPTVTVPQTRGSALSRRSSASLQTQYARRPLPKPLQVLSAIFNGLEDVQSFMSSRNQASCVFHKIRAAVEHQCGQSFHLSHLAQIVSVYPEAYTLQPMRVVHAGQRVSSILIDIPRTNSTDTPILDALSDPSAARRLSDARNDRSSTGPAATASSPSVVHHGTFAKRPTRAIDSSNTFLSVVQAASSMTSRRQEFAHRLESLVNDAHEAFLEQRRLDGHDVDREMQGVSPLRWHPLFDLESVPPVPQAPLPEPELSHLEKLKLKAKSVCLSSGLSSPMALVSQRSNATILAEALLGNIPTRRLSEAHAKQPESLAAAPSTPKTAASALGSATTPAPTSACTLPDTLSSSTAEPAKPKSRAAALLERLKEKQRLKAEAESHSAPPPTLAHIKYTSTLSRLPAVSQCVCMLAASTGKKTFEMHRVVRHVMESMPVMQLGPETVERCLTMLAEVVPAFCEIIGSRLEPRKSLAGTAPARGAAMDEAWRPWGPNTFFRLIESTTASVKATVQRLLAEAGC